MYYSGFYIKFPNILWGKNLISELQTQVYVCDFTVFWKVHILFQITRFGFERLKLSLQFEVVDVSLSNVTLTHLISYLETQVHVCK